MNIWYLHHYATPYEIPGLHRPFEFGEYFIKEGNQITVFSSSYLHYANSNMIDDNAKYRIENYGGVSTVFIKTCGYENSSCKRVINMLQFGVKLPKIAKQYAKKTGVPDIIIASSPHPFTMLTGLKLAKKYNIPCICEVRDFWPEVFFYGGRLKESSIIGKSLLRVERYIYEKANGITFLKEGDYTYILEKGWDIDGGGKVDIGKCSYINNGVDIKLYDKRIKENNYDDEDFNSGKFIVTYCGTIRPVNNIDLILDTAKIIGDDYMFVVFGTGNCVEALQQRIDEEHIGNVKLKGYVNNQYIPSILQHSSLNLLNYSGVSYNWSRGNSSNKLFEYLASGKPVLSTVKMGYDIIEKYGCGASVQKTEPEEIAKEIRKIRLLPPDEYRRLCHNARYAAEQFDIPVLAQKYLNEINEVMIKFYLNKRRKEK